VRRDGLFPRQGDARNDRLAAGCFADPDLPKLERLYWASQRHHWLDLGEDVSLKKTQPG
jgi:hypothetical protein